ncbi:MAG: hypothetical protein A3H97_07320 [Acidobacteria bacterium RIFCSPLOWO2_02_FULL_65_29]|nr:MAG: hypothetical protein A3H97_07320 [Acidobacteria bacterium RIFCSPLOWO2_02_FULL_65_29]
MTFAVAALLALSATTHAHEAEHTAVSFTFSRDGTFDVRVANDPNWLLLRLESFLAMESGSTTARAAGRPNGRDRDARLRALAAVFIDRIVIWVDGREVRPESAEYVPPAPQGAADGQQPLAAYRLRGRVPAGASTLRWYYGMVADAYPLSVARADGRIDKEWIVTGDAWSRTLDLAGQFAAPSPWAVAREYATLGYVSVLPRGAGFVLFVLGLLLLRLERAPIVRQVAAFTVAHSAALWVVALGGVTAPAWAVGSAIALSVAYVAIENLATRTVKPWRVALVAVFGLAHGAALGNAFAAVPAPLARWTTALTAFNVGVEIAELTVLALASLGALMLHGMAAGRTSSIGSG